jgi:hypothetical protein
MMDRRGFLRGLAATVAASVAGLGAGGHAAAAVVEPAMARRSRLEWHNSPLMNLPLINNDDVDWDRVADALVVDVAGLGATTKALAEQTAPFVWFHDNTYVGVHDPVYWPDDEEGTDAAPKSLAEYGRTLTWDGNQWT